MRKRKIDFIDVRLWLDSYFCMCCEVYNIMLLGSGVILFMYYLIYV